VLFKVFGPYRLPRDDAKHVAATAQDRSKFWSAVAEIEPGLPDACGCYVFSLKAGRGSKPWYVGKAERSTFRTESLSPHKLNHFNVITARHKGIPELYLLAQITPSGAFRAPTQAKRPAIRELESMLIGMGVARNPKLLNSQGTKMLKELRVEGFLNSSLAKRGAAKSLRNAFET
jgi:hypothetical protein